NILHINIHRKIDRDYICHGARKTFVSCDVGVEMIEPTERMPSVSLLPAETVNTILTALMSAEGALDLVYRKTKLTATPSRRCGWRSTISRICSPDGVLRAAAGPLSHCWICYGTRCPGLLGTVCVSSEASSR